MIEAIFDEKHEKEFNRAIKEAIYYSPRTRVVVLPDSKKYLVPDESHTEAIEENKPYLRIDGKTFYIDNAPHDLLYYLAVYMDYDNSFSFKVIQQLAVVMNNGLVEVSDEFKNVFSKLWSDATFSDLECSKYRFRINKKNQGFDLVKNVKLTDVFSDIVITKRESHIETLEINNVNNMKDFKGIEFTEFFGQYYDNDAKSDEERVIDVSHRIYGKNGNLNKILSSNKTITVELDNENKVLNILPDGITSTKYSELITPSKESKKLLNKLPVALFRMAYYEYVIRQEIS